MFKSGVELSQFNQQIIPQPLNDDWCGCSQLRLD